MTTSNAFSDVHRENNENHYILSCLIIIAALELTSLQFSRTTPDERASVGCTLCSCYYDMFQCLSFSSSNALEGDEQQKQIMLHHCKVSRERKETARCAFESRCSCVSNDVKNVFMLQETLMTYSLRPCLDSKRKWNCSVIAARSL